MKLPDLRPPRAQNRQIVREKCQIGQNPVCF